jgi:hypothetical protein
MTELEPNIDPNLGTITIIGTYKDEPVTFTSNENATLGTIHDECLSKFRLGPYEFGYVLLSRADTDNITIGSEDNSYHKPINEYECENNSYEFKICERDDGKYNNSELAQIKEKYIRYQQEKEDAKIAEQMNTDIMCSYYNGAANVMNTGNPFEQFLMNEALPRLLNDGGTRGVNLLPRSAAIDEYIAQHGEMGLPELEESQEDDITPSTVTANTGGSNAEPDSIQLLVSQLGSAIEGNNTSEGADVRITNLLMGVVDEMLNDPEQSGIGRRSSRRRSRVPRNINMDDYDDEDIKVVLTRDEYRRLKHQKFEDYELKEENDTCTICLEKFETEDEIVQAKCKHIFHTKCGRQWFLKNSTKCPNCRVQTAKGKAVL